MMREFKLAFSLVGSIRFVRVLQFSESLMKRKINIGDHGTFCAGADLKGFSSVGTQNRLEPEGDGYVEQQIVFTKTKPVPV